jgi:hypothetical protein
MPKVFRIDGEIKTAICIDLIAKFFRGNEMITEYFDPQAYLKAYARFNVPWSREKGI